MSERHEDNLPPVIRLLLSERWTKNGQPVDMLKALRRLMPELRRQAEWSIQHFDYERALKAQPLGSFVALPGAAADPLTPYAACRWIDCRANAALDFSRTIGLYADTAILPDTFTSRLFFSKRFEFEDYAFFLSDMFVLAILKPLIESGIVRFRLPIATFCETHRRQFEYKVEEVANTLLPSYSANLGVEVEADSIRLRNIDPEGSALGLTVPLTARLRRELARATSPLVYGRKLYNRALIRQVEEMLTEHMHAARLQAAVVSSSRLHMLVARNAEGKLPDLGRVDIWEDRHSATLSWVKDLSPSQIVALREEASSALPRFREYIGHVLVSSDQQADDHARQVVRELRAEAAEVKSELVRLKKSKRSLFRNVAGSTLGMTISLYGLATGAAAESSALLMGLLGLLHADRQGEHTTLASLKSRPGYVLLKAEELRRHTAHTTD